MKVNSSGEVKFDTREELIATARKNNMSIYIVRHHRNLQEFVLDMESRGMKTSVFPQYFDYVIFPDGRVEEIIGYQPDPDELLTNTIFVAKDDIHPGVEGISYKRFKDVTP